MRTFIPSVAIMLTALCAACGSGQTDAPSDTSSTVMTIGTEVGDAAPDFTLSDTAGTSVRLSSLHGKVVLVDFWGTWCAPCLASLPTLKEIWATDGAKEFVIVSVAVSQNSKDWLAFLRTNGLGWTEVIDPGNEVAARYQVLGIPSTFLLDRNGRIVAKNLSGAMLADSVTGLLR